MLFSSKTVQAILCAVQTALSQYNISRGLWSPRLPDQNLQSEFYLSGMVSDQEYSNNLQTEDKLSESIQNAVSTIPPTDLKPLNIFLSLTFVCQPKETIPSSFIKYDNNTDTQRTEMAASVALPAITRICHRAEGKVVTRQYNTPVILI
jgi:hypothetical protein